MTILEAPVSAVETFYRIRRKSDGLFLQAAGGGWNEHGRVWPTIGRAKCALKFDRYEKADKHEIVAYEVREVGVVGD
jgi:hypothetical protein